MCICLAITVFDLLIHELAAFSSLQNIEPICTSLDFHPNHDLNGLFERRGEEEIRFGELASENQYLGQDQPGSVLLVKGRVAGGERLTGWPA